MIDIATVCQGYQDGQIDNIGFVRYEHNLADGLTKQTKQAALEILFKTTRDRLIVQQWVIRHRSKEVSAEENQS